MLMHSLRTPVLAIITTLSAIPLGQLHRRVYRPEDFEKLRWIEGTWQGAANGKPFYECYHFVNDSTIEMVSSGDARFTTVSERATIALRGGRIFDENGKNRWEAAALNAAMAHFIPVRGATNAFQFTRMSRDRWTATIIPANGRRIAYEMRKL